MEFRTVGDRVVNDAGQVAVKYFQPMAQTLKIRSKTYVFQVKKNLSIAWIDAEDVEEVINVTKVCCGGNRNKVFRLEHELHVKRWLNLVE